jgi:Flp pilus assembly protein TadD
MAGLIQQNLSEPPKGSARALTTKPRSWEAEGKQLIQTGLFDQALTLFRKIKEKNPKDPRPYFYSGLALMESGNLTGAASELDEAVRLAPKRSEYALFQASVMVRLGQKEEALKSLATFHDVQKINLLTPAWMWLLADTYYRSNQPDQALKVLDLLAKRTPQDAKIDLNQGQAYVAKGQLEVARKCFENSIHKQTKRNPLAYYELGRLLHQLNELPSARKSLETAVQQEPDNVQYKYKLALVCLALNEDVVAIRFLRQVEDSASKYPEIYYALGRALRKTGNRAEAETYFRLFQDSNSSARHKTDQSQEAGKLISQGERQLDLGNPGQARKLFEEAVKAEPNDWSAHGYLAEMLLGSPNWRGAYPHLVKMEEVEPDSVVGNYLMARYWFLSQDFAQACDYAERAKALRPANAELRNLLGQIYLQLERTSDALTEFEEAVRLAPNQKEYHENLKTLRERLAQSGH